MYIEPFKVISNQDEVSVSIQGAIKKFKIDIKMMGWLSEDKVFDNLAFIGANRGQILRVTGGVNDQGFAVFAIIEFADGKKEMCGITKEIFNKTYAIDGAKDNALLDEWQNQLFKDFIQYLSDRI